MSNAVLRLRRKLSETLAAIKDDWKRKGLYFGNCDKRGNRQILYFLRQRASWGVARRYE